MNQKYLIEVEILKDELGDDLNTRKLSKLIEDLLHYNRFSLVTERGNGYIDIAGIDDLYDDDGDIARDDADVIKLRLTFLGETLTFPKDMFSDKKEVDNE